eukprot:4207509-Pleurochrysis_carterae.AAC.1
MNDKQNQNRTVYRLLPVRVVGNQNPQNVQAYRQLQISSAATPSPSRASPRSMQRTASMVLAAIAAQPVAVAAFLQPAKWRTLQAAIGPLGSRSCTSCAKVRVGADQRFSSASSASGFREYEGHFGEVLHDSRTRRSSISSPLTLLASQFSPRKQNCCAPYRTRECQMCASHYLEEGCVVEYRLQVRKPVV